MEGLYILLSESSQSEKGTCPLSHLGSIYKNYKGVIISMHRTVLFLPEILSNPDIRRKLKFTGQLTARKKDVDNVS